MVSRVEDSCILFAHETLETPEKRLPMRGAAKFSTQDVDSLFHLSMESYDHMRRKADCYHIVRDYFIEVQKDLSRYIREQVVSWLVDTGHAIALNSQTTAIAVNCFDRFLGQRRIPAELVSDVAAAVLLIASKVHDGKPPPLSYLASYTDSEPEKIVVMEAVILDKLRWQVNTVTSNDFVPYMIRLLKRLGFVASEKLVEMLLDVSLLDYELAQMSTCTVAAASVLLASELENPDIGPSSCTCAYADSLQLDVDDLLQAKERLYSSFQAFFAGSKLI